MSSLSGSDDELGEMEVDGDGSSEFTSDEDEEGVADETLYRKKYTFVKRIAKNIIYVGLPTTVYIHGHTHPFNYFTVCAIAPCNNITVNY